MVKKIFRNVPLYLLSVLVLVSSFQNGFTWLSWAALGLSAAVLVIDILIWRRQRTKDATERD